MRAHIRLLPIPVVSPRIYPPVRPSRRFLPLCLTRQSFPCPSAIESCLVPIYTVDGMIFSPFFFPVAGISAIWECTRFPLHTSPIVCHRYLSLIDGKCWEVDPSP